jgi:hypothetical protein
MPHKRHHLRAALFPRIFWQAAASAILSLGVQAQVGRVVVLNSNPTQHAANCRNAATVLAQGFPDSQQDSAQSTILRGCHGERPAALVAAVRRLYASHNTKAFTFLLRAAASVRDTSFFNAALEMAGRSNASVEAVPRVSSSPQWSSTTT